jgi:hypothetical protein
MKRSEMMDSYGKIAPRAVERIGELIESPDERVALVAAKAVTDQISGLAPRAPRLEGASAVDLHAMGDDELRLLAESAMALIEARAQALDGAAVFGAVRPMMVEGPDADRKHTLPPILEGVAVEVTSEVSAGTRMNRVFVPGWEGGPGRPIAPVGEQPPTRDGIMAALDEEPSPVVIPTPGGRSPRGAVD